MSDFGDQVSRSHGRLHRRARAALLLTTTALSSPLLIGSALAQNLPTGGSVAAGGVAISQPSATQLNITQTSQSAIVNWQSFSIGQGSAVNIQQPNSTSALLNRVTGDAPSSIAGSLTANGQVYLVNPNGIAITSTGVVNTVGAFVASTLGISDADFQSGKRTFTGNGASAGVSNAGVIAVGRGGYAALLGGTVSNAGKIIVPLGKVGLGSGESATLDFSGDGFLQVALPTAAGGNGALISNSGSIRANGGSVIISAATAREAARNAVNISGLVEARTIGGQSGSIFIGGGAGGGVNVSGHISATSRQAAGGAVTVTGQNITLAGATIDASGKTGGGSINIGGGSHGQGPLQQADTVTIDSQTKIHADAIATGNGGNVVVWSNGSTGVQGLITARGGAGGGNGGNVETSGDSVDFTGLRVDTSAPSSRSGMWLVDPTNLTVDAASATTISNNLATTDVTLQTSANGASGTGVTSNGAGDIIVNSGISWSSNHMLNLTAYNAITINASININGAGGIALNAAGQTGVTTTGLTFGNGASIDYGATDHGGTFSLNGTSYALVYSMAQLDAIDGVNAVNGAAVTTYGAGLTGAYALATNLNAAGTTYTRALIGTDSSGDAATRFAGQLDGIGHTITGLTISAATTDYAGLLGFVTGVNTSVSDLGLVGGSVIGANNVGSLVGWLDTGAVVQNDFSSAAVTGTGINNTGGLIGFDTGTVQSSYASGSVTGIFGTGGLIGWAAPATITNSYATGAVSGGSNTGGLIGINFANVVASYATGAVTGTGTQISGAGGLIGDSQGGSVSASYATGAVSITGNFGGGLIGINTGNVDASYATGAVTGASGTGGLIGNLVSGAVNASHASGTVTGVTNTGGLIGVVNGGLVQASYATGVVKGIGGPRAGGLVGQNAGTIETSYATGAVFAGTNAAGGLVGANSGTVSSSYATGAVAAALLNVGGLIGNNTGTVSSSYSTGTVTGPGAGATVGGLIGANAGSGTVAASYWDMQTSGWTTSQGGSGGVGLTTAQLQGVLQTGFSTAAWGTGTGLYPYLTWQFAAGTTPQSLSGIAYQANGTALAGATIDANVNGAAFANTGTGANCYYYFLLPQGSIASGNGIFIDVAGNAVKANAYVQDTSGSVQNLNLNAGMLDIVTGATALSSVASGLASAVGNLPTTDLLFTTPGGVLTPNAGTGVSIAASGAFSVDQNLVVPNALLLNAAGSLTVASTGSLSSSSGNVTLVDGSSFINNAGAAVSAANGRWLIYSVDPGNDVRGGLTYNFKQYAATYGATAVAQATGNGVLYSIAPVISPTASKTYDGSTSATIASSANGIDGDVLAISSSSATYDNANAGTGKTVTANGLTITSATNGAAIVYGYTLGSVAGTITPRAITVTADTQSRAYGDANPALSYVIGGGGLVSGDSLSGSLATSATTATSVGSYGITQGSLANSNYSATYTGANLTITARPLTVTADARSRIYGDANPTLTYGTGGGLVNGDQLTGSLATSATTATGVGSYGITQGTLGNSDYALSYVGANLTITARPITVTASALSQVYGDATPTLTSALTGGNLVNGDQLTGSLATSATNTTGVGSYGITQGSLAASNNYALTYTGANLTITARPLTVTANAQSQVYGDADPTLTYAIGGRGLVNGDNLTGSLATTATNLTGVGSYGITQGSVAPSNNNYALTYVGANLTITARPLTVTADAQSRVYGDANPALTYGTGGGLVNGDSLTGNLATGATTATGVGSYGITQGTLGNSNYALTYVGANLTITARPLTVTANAQSQVYGDADPTLTYAIGGRGLVNGDNLTGSLATTATNLTGVGSYGITQGSVAPSNNNYALTYVGANLTITPRSITVTADAQTQVYGDANPLLTYVIGGRGLVNGDGLLGGLATSATNTTGVGSYGITQGNLAASSNYALSYTGANLAITARPLTVTANAQTQVYGDANPALTYTIGGRGLVNGDSLNGNLATNATNLTGVGSYGITQGSVAPSNSNYALTYIGANLTITARALTVTADAKSQIYGDANPTLTYAVGGGGLVNGDNLTENLATSATNLTGVGSYSITQGSLGNSNYAVTYIGANLTITPRPITVTADNGQTREYGDANPTLTSALTGGNLVNGDQLTGSLVTSATNTTGVGSYGITQGNLAASSNYVVTYIGANLAITPRSITVTADALSKIVGDDNPDLTYVVGGRGLVNGDSLSGSLATGATTTSAVGTYGITQGTVTNVLNPNYAIAYTGANLTVNAAPPAQSTPPATTLPVIVATSDPSTPKQATINFQSDQSTTAVITPLAATSSTSGTRGAARQTNDDDIVTGSIDPRKKKKKKPHPAR